MAVTNTITTYQMPWRDSGDVTKKYVEILQTSGSKATMGGVPIFGSATASNDFHLMFLDVSLVNPTASAYADVYIGTDKIATLPTCSAGVTQHYSWNFGPVGLTGGTTTTATVSIFTTTGTVTVQFIAVGCRNL